jgi:phospholipid transport system substrate-binding protein
METIRSAVLLLLSFVAAASHAAQVAPDALLRGVTSDVIASLKQDQGQADDPARIAGLIKAKVVPVFDFSLMTQFAMARNWRLATPGQQHALTAEFKAMLVRTYSATLADYRDATITYKPLRALAGDTDATVRSDIKQGARRLKIDYEMSRTPEGWKVYDVKLDGISLVTAFRGGFAAKIRDSGVDGLIRALTEKNRESLSPTKTAAAVAGS